VVLQMILLLTRSRLLYAVEVSLDFETAYIADEHRGISRQSGKMSEILVVSRSFWSTMVIGMSKKKTERRQRQTM
jgi:hypothetical protein